MASRRNNGMRDTMGGGSVPPSLPDFDSAAFGRIGSVDSSRQTAEATDIFMIVPDLKQPRRVMPSKIRRAWNGNPKTLGALFNYWRDEAEKERNGEFSIMAYFEDAPMANAENDGPLARALDAVCALAVSIQRDGLTNAITVARMGREYVIETGERRWLAFHLLAAMFGEKWQRIPARVVPQVDILRQATENTVREDLNAIGKARQFALILMHLLEQDGQTFRPFGEFSGGCDRGFYAQVADGNEFRVPRGKGELLANALGVKGGSQVREVRSVLSVADEIWMEADDNNWSLGRLLRYVEGQKQPTSDTYRRNSDGIDQSHRGDTFSIDNVSDEPPAITPAEKRQKDYVTRELESLDARILQEEVKPAPDADRLATLKARKEKLERDGTWADPTPTVLVDEPEAPDAGITGFAEAIYQIGQLRRCQTDFVEVLETYQFTEQEQAQIKKAFNEHVNDCGQILVQMKRQWG